MTEINRDVWRRIVRGPTDRKKSGLASPMGSHLHRDREAERRPACGQAEEALPAQME